MKNVTPTKALGHSNDSFSKEYDLDVRDNELTMNGS